MGRGNERGKGGKGGGWKEERITKGNGWGQ